MGFNCGIVGLPNVGKSTLFNALTATAAAQASNFPFCTIDPNVGRVSVPDSRLNAIAEIAKSAKIIPTQLEFVDIAGLVRGASKGEGLGNQFLGHIRQVDAIVHLVRCFEDDDITHVEGSIDPTRDIETIQTELMLADMESLEKRLPALEKKAKGTKDPVIDVQIRLMKQALDLLREGQPARLLEVAESDQEVFEGLQLLTSKPVLYVCNMSESEVGQDNAYTKQVRDLAAKEGAVVAVISAEIEQEIAQLEEAEDQADFLQSLGLEETGLSQVVRKGYELLDLITFFTVGPKEARAWTVYKGAKAPQAAGVIHTDFERGFICAETIACDDFVAQQGEQGAKAAGKMRQEGKEYLVKDGDVFHFRFNV